MKACVKVIQELGLNSSKESAVALESVKYGPVHDIEEITNGIFNQLIDEFETLYPDFKYVKAELHYYE